MDKKQKLLIAGFSIISKELTTKNRDTTSCISWTKRHKANIHGVLIYLFLFHAFIDAG